MQRFHILMSLSRPLEDFDEMAAADRSPRHGMSLLRDALGAEVILPGDTMPTRRNRIEAHFPGIGTAEHWANAAALARKLGPGDTTFAIGEDAGFPLAARLSDRHNRTRMAIFLQSPARFRVRQMFRFCRLSEVLDIVFTNTPHKRDYVVSQLGMAPERVFCTMEQTDTMFFRPGPPAAAKTRPLIGSGGLEQRDYITLAQATEAMEVDIRISAVSPNATAHGDTFPNPLPGNMVARHHDWEELRQLYWDSDIFVISLKQNSYQAGLTTLMEAFACKTPVVMTRTSGSMEEFEQAGALLAVPPKNPTALREAINRLLCNPDFAAKQAERAFALVHRKHRLEGFVANLSEHLHNL